MPIVLMTYKEKRQLLDVLDIHLDGLEVTKAIAMNDIDGPEMLEAVAAVDEAIALTKKLTERVRNAF